MSSSSRTRSYKIPVATKGLMSDPIQELVKQYFFYRPPMVRCVMLLETLTVLLQDDVGDRSTLLKRIAKPIGKYLSASSKNALKYINKFLINYSISTDEIIRRINMLIEQRIVISQERLVSIALKRLEGVNNVLIFGYSPLISKIVADKRVYLCDDPRNPTLKDTLKDRKEITYLYPNALSYVLPSVEAVVLGCTEVMANGDIMGFTGTALVSLLAHTNNIPVLLCCETLAFTNRVQSSIEIGQYDITPAKYISQMITEKGIIHPSSAHLFCPSKI